MRGALRLTLVAVSCLVLSVGAASAQKGHHGHHGGHGVGGAGIIGGVIGGVIGGAMNAAPQEMEPCAAWAAIVREDRLAGVPLRRLRAEEARYY